jgi:hypothetical protein
MIMFDFCTSSRIWMTCSILLAKTQWSGFLKIDEWASVPDFEDPTQIYPFKTPTLHDLLHARHERSKDRGTCLSFHTVLLSQRRSIGIEKTLGRLLREKCLNHLFNYPWQTIGRHVYRWPHFFWLSFSNGKAKSVTNPNLTLYRSIGASCFWYTLLLEPSHVYLPVNPPFSNTGGRGWKSSWIYNLKRKI